MTQPYSSNHMYVLIMNLMIPIATFAITFTPLVIHDMDWVKGLYMGAGMWWMFAIISSMPLQPQPRPPEYVHYGKWLLMMPVAAIIINNFTPFDFYAERMYVFNSVMITWVGMTIWILTDWYRWKFRPSPRQLRLMKYYAYLDERQAKIDATPSCVVPSGLTYIQQES